MFSVKNYHNELSAKTTRALKDKTLEGMVPDSGIEVASKINDRLACTKLFNAIPKNIGTLPVVQRTLS